VQEESDNHWLISDAVDPIRTLEEISNTPNPLPNIEIKDEPVVGTVLACMEETLVGKYERDRGDSRTALVTETVGSNNDPCPDAALTRSDESDVQTVLS